MSQQERYIQSVHEHVFVCQEDWLELEADLKAHFAADRDKDRTEAETIARLGDPEEVAASVMSGRQLAFAGFWLRAVAFLVDFILLGVASLPALMILGPLAAALDHGDGNAVWMILIGVPIGITLLGLWIVYFPLAEALYGKTLGKHLFGLRVLTESGTRISAGQAILRRLPFYLEIFVIDALFAPFTDKKQRAFDMVAKTVVVRDHA